MVVFGNCWISANIMTLAPLFYVQVLQKIQDKTQIIVHHNIYVNLRIAKLEHVGKVCSTHLEILEFEIMKFRNFETLKLRNFGTLKLRSFGSLEV